jgi:hypothetical protein
MRVEEQLRGKNLAEEYMRQFPRRFHIGDVYAPHDLSAVEMKKWRGITTAERDLVDMLGLKPVDMYRVSSNELYFRPRHIVRCSASACARCEGKCTAIQRSIFTLVAIAGTTLTINSRISHLYQSISRHMAVSSRPG